MDMRRDILKAVQGGEKVMNKILNRAAIQWMPGKQLVDDLVDQGCLERRKTSASRYVYYITGEGLKALETYERVATYIE